MATSEAQQSLAEYTTDDSEDDLDECPECGRSAMDSDTPCSRCQPPQPDETEEDFDKDQCQNCGAHVSKRFRRVRGDNNDIAHACRECAPRNHEYPYAVAGVSTESIPVIQR